MADPKKPRTLKALAAPAADEAAPVTYALAIAIRALRDGTATAHQQQAVLEWIVSEASAKRYFPYRGNDRDTAFALGRLFVGEQIVGLLHADLSSLRRQFDVQDQDPTDVAR